jgi:uncharacterized protein YjbJ (UPF0337 family)
MNKEQIDGKFEQLKGVIKQTWGKLTDDEVLSYKGKQDQFFGKLQEKYGIAKADAEKKIEEMEKTCMTAACATDKATKVA